MTITRVDTVVDDQEYGLAAGTWQFQVVIGTGPTTFEMSDQTGGTFTLMTDGTFSASQDGTMQWGQGNIFKAQLGAGDTVTLSKID
jgi:hypothetical protein